MKRKLKGSTFGGILVTLLIVAIIVIVLIKLGILSFGGFGNGGDGDSVPANATVSETAEAVTEPTTVQETKFVEITVDGENYLYSNQSYGLDELMEEISKIEGGYEVHIYLSETATLAAREALEAKLDEKNVFHDIIEKDE